MGQESCCTLPAAEQHTVNLDEGAREPAGSNPIQNQQLGITVSRHSSRASLRGVPHDKNIGFHDRDVSQVSSMSPLMTNHKSNQHLDHLLNRPSRTDKGYYNSNDQLEFLTKVITIQKLVRKFLIKIKKRLPTKADKARKLSQVVYFEDSDYYETLSDKRRIAMVDLKFSSKPKLEYRTHTFELSKSIYEGQWLGGFRHGQGKITFHDGAVYNGTWFLGQANGQGVFSHVTGEVYDGDWVLGKAHGYGEFKHQSGAIYKGQWFTDKQHGSGYEVWPDGSSYEGNYTQGIKNGFGFNRWTDGSQYVGNWVDNEIQGFGHYKWVDGRQYIGNWQQNVKSGYGVFKWPDSRSYEGYFKSDNKHGYGYYTYKDKSRHMGSWFNNKQHGFGIYEVADGRKNFGCWRMGKPSDIKPEVVKQLTSGQLDPKAFLQEDDVNWDELQEYTHKLFHPNSAFEEARRLHAKVLQHHNQLVDRLQQSKML